MIHFDWPWIFLLLPLPWLVRYLWPPIPERGNALLVIPYGSQLKLPCSTSTSNRQSSWLVLIIAYLIWMLLLCAASAPQWRGEPVTLMVSGRDLLLAVDLSGSMEVKDFQLQGKMVDRLTAIKQVAGEFIQRRQGDRLGLILFGRNAYLQAPLTFDRKTVQIFLDEAVIGLAGKETAIGDAIGLAIKKFQDHPQNQQVLILLTDGANTAGQITPLKAAQLAASEGLKIYTIGIGADERMTNTLHGNQRVNPSSDLDEKTLTSIAKHTGGRYFRARDTVALENIYQLLDQLEPIEDKSRIFRPTQSLYYWPLGLGLLLGYGLLWHHVGENKWLPHTTKRGHL